MTAISEIENVNLRADLWVLPVPERLRHLWPVVGQHLGQHRLARRLHLEGRHEREHLRHGLHAAGGLQGFWFAYDTNWTWSDLDLLAEPVGTRIVGLRVGKNYRWHDKSVAAWVGAMKVDLESGTEGTVKLSEVMPEVPPELGDEFDEWYDSLTPPQQAVIDRIRGTMDGDIRDAEIHYNLDKAPT